MPLEPLWLHSLSSLFRCQTGSFYFSLPKQLAIMTDSPLEEIAAIVKAKVRPYECNDKRLRQIKESMEKPLDAVQIAKAYFSSQALRKLEQFQDDPIMHAVQLLLNDLLACKIRMDGTCNENFEQAITNVAGGNCLNRNQMSQFKHAFNKIETCGQSRAEFDKTFRLSKYHPYKLLSATEQDAIFEAFVACSNSTSSGMNGRKSRKRRNRKRSSPQHHSSGQVVQDFNAMLDDLAEQLRGMQHVLSLLKKEEEEESEKLQAARLSKIAEHNSKVAQLLDQWTWRTHASAAMLLSF